ncbi:MAG: fibronectin type III domain-containing protein, partial [Clostridiales bacterium]|nr:fibronectin type III domain-containing protein [Candidatus Equinaster intestinalis]
MKKFAKKTLAVIVAVAIVLCCVTVSFSSFAETSAFSVTEASPAVPLYVDKAIDLNTLPVEIGAATVFADTLDWEPISGNSARIVSGMLVGVSEGITRFKVGNDTASYTVYVIVNEQGDNDFSIIDIDFNDADTFSQSDWYGIASASWSSVNLYTSGTTFNRINSCCKFKEVTTSDNVKRNAMYLASISDLGGTKGALFHSDMLNNFGDYTIEAQMSHIMSQSKTTGSNMISAAGIMARVSLADTAATESTNPLNKTVKSLHFRIRNYGGLTITAYAGSNSTSGNNYLANDIAYSYYNGDVTADDLWREGDSTKVFKPDAKGTEKPTIRNIKLSLKGSDIAYSIDGNEILNTAKGDINSMFVPVNNSQGTTSTSPTSTGTSALLDASYANKTYTAGPTISGSDYKDLYKQNLQAQKGTIGFTMNYAGDVYVYSVKVTPQNIVEAMPIIHDLSDDYTDGIPVNSRYDLSKDDASVIWDNVKTDDYEIKNGIITVYSKPADGQIIVTGKKQGKMLATMLEIIDAGTETAREVTTFADKEMKVVPNPLLPDRFTVIIDDTDDNEVVHGSIKVKDGDEEFTVYNTAASGEGNAFEFAVANPDKMEISVEYTTREENIASIYNLGATVRITEDKAIRYLTRIPSVVKTPAGIAFESGIKVNGETVTPVSVGSLLIPSVLLGDSELEFPENYEGGALTVNGYPVQHRVIENLSKVTDKYSDAYTTIGGFTNGGKDFDPLDIDIAEVSYICYEDEEGNEGYIYSDKRAVSYNGILEKAFPLKETDTDLAAAISGGTSHDLDPYDYTTNLSYGIGEDITFKYQIKGAYTIDWKLYKDNPADNVIEEIGEVCGGNAYIPVAQGKTQPGDKVFTLTTRMKQADMLSLVITVTDSYGNPVKYNGGETAELTQKAGAVQEVFTDKLATANLGNNVCFHTDLQHLFITDRATALKTAKGTAELSKPAGVTLNWQSTVEDVLNFIGYKVTIGEGRFFANSKEYTTDQTSLNITNLKLGTEYCWKVEALYNGKTYYSMPETFKTEDSAPRNMSDSRLTNVPDLGGGKNTDGASVKQGIRYRWIRLYDVKNAILISPEVITTMLNDMGVKIELDFRLGWQTGIMTTSPLGRTVF